MYGGIKLFLEWVGYFFIAYLICLLYTSQSAARPSSSPSVRPRYIVSMVM